MKQSASDKFINAGIALTTGAVISLVAKGAGANTEMAVGAGLLIAAGTFWQINQGAKGPQQTGKRSRHQVNNSSRLEI